MTIFQKVSCRQHVENDAGIDHAGAAPHKRVHPIDDEADGKIISVRRINSDADRTLAEQLINRMYGWRGYGSDHRLPETEYCMTFIAHTDDDDVVGTLTLNVDSPEGLALDQTFSRELAEYRRQPGARICELSKFAFDPSIQSKTVLAAMFNTIYIHGSGFNCTDLFIEVNPRHRRFYEALLGFKRIGTIKANASVAAPSQLMWARVATIRQNIERNGASGTRSGRSFYPFLSSTDMRNGIRIAPRLPQPEQVLI